MVAVSKVTSTGVPSAVTAAAIATLAAAVAANTATHSYAFVTELHLALTSHVPILSAVTVLDVKRFATSRPTAHNYIGCVFLSVKLAMRVL